jgi:LysR family transcriptional regulator, hydrogen peroxide-inducible genes activator
VELAQIKYFLALCEARNFTKAAKQCGISQPSLSNAIAALEAELGDALVQRAPFALTPTGKAIRPHFRGVLRHIHQASKLGGVGNRPAT